MIWLNGTFGVGKTSTADELVRRMPGSRLYDPEEVGFLLHRLLPEAADSDFQDIPAWRLWSPRPQSRYTPTPVLS